MTLIIFLVVVILATVIASGVVTQNCNHNQSCQGTIISTNSNRNITINCWTEESCSDAEINATNSHNVIVNCIGIKSCVDMGVNCGTGDCYVNCINTEGSVCHGVHLACGLGGCTINCSGPSDSYKCDPKSLALTDTDMPEKFQCIGDKIECEGAPNLYDPSIPITSISTNMNNYMVNTNQENELIYIIITLSVIVAIGAVIVLFVCGFKTLKYLVKDRIDHNIGPDKKIDAMAVIKARVSEVKTIETTEILPFHNTNWIDSEAIKEMNAPKYEYVFCEETQEYKDLPYRKTEEGHWNVMTRDSKNHNKQRSSVELGKIIQNFDSIKFEE